MVIAAAAPAVLLQNGAQASAATSAHSHSSLALSVFASKIETLGVVKYSHSFAGAKLTSAGVTDVYLTSPSNRAFVAAVNSLNTSDFPVEFINVKSSYAALDALNLKVAAATARLRGEGIFLTASYPDPATGTVVVDIKKPGTNSFSELASAKRRSVTAATYPAEVSGTLHSMFGSSVVLGEEVAAALRPMARDSDTPAFYDGDQIINLDNGYGCTGGYNVLNDHDQPYMLTAGHCGDGTYATTAAVIGNTSSNWFSESTKKPYPTVYDVQAIKINSTLGGIGYVWTDYGNVAPVVDWLVPAEGATLTANGSVTGEQHGDVAEVDVITENIYDSIGNAYYNAIHQIWIVNSNPSVAICIEGDSGGPVYQQYTDSTAVSATGIITAGGIYEADGVDIGALCSSTMISSILSEFSLTLETGS
jgi:hypothetical protein